MKKRSPFGPFTEATQSQKIHEDSDDARTAQLFPKACTGVAPSPATSGKGRLSFLRGRGLKQVPAMHRQRIVRCLLWIAERVLRGIGRRFYVQP